MRCPALLLVCLAVCVGSDASESDVSLESFPLPPTARVVEVVNAEPASESSAYDSGTLAIFLGAVEIELPLLSLMQEMERTPRYSELHSYLFSRLGQRIESWMMPSPLREQAEQASEPQVWRRDFRLVRALDGARVESYFVVTQDGVPRAGAYALRDGTVFYSTPSFSYLSVPATKTARIAQSEVEITSSICEHCLLIARCSPLPELFPDPLENAKADLSLDFLFADAAGAR